MVILVINNPDSVEFNSKIELTSGFTVPIPTWAVESVVIKKEKDKSV
jgi:hypothetical protein